MKTNSTSNSTNQVNNTTNSTKIPVNNTTNSTNDALIPDNQISGFGIIKRPMNFINFVTGLLVGSNLTGTDESLNVCHSTLNNDVINNAIIVRNNIFSTSPNNIFTTSYSIANILYYSN